MGRGWGAGCVLGSEIKKKRVKVRALVSKEIKVAFVCHIPLLTFLSAVLVLR